VGSFHFQWPIDSGDVGGGGHHHIGSRRIYTGNVSEAAEPISCRTSPFAADAAFAATRRVAVAAAQKTLK
jgi:hypothetical protein